MVIIERKTCGDNYLNIPALPTTPLLDRCLRKISETPKAFLSTEPCGQCGAVSRSVNTFPVFSKTKIGRVQPA